jgi:DNA-binding response OmpR family regulator
MVPPKILLLDDSEDLRLVMAQLIQVRAGVASLGVGTLAELAANANAALQTRAAFLDINLGPGEPSGVEALAWLRDNRYGGQVFFLTGHAENHPTVVLARQTGIRVLTKPLPSAELIALVKSALGEGGAA